MSLGASTRSFGGKTVSETARIFKDARLNCAELCFCQTDLAGWKHNFFGRAEIPSVRDIKNAVEIFAQSGITVSALGFYGCFFGGSSSDFVETLRAFDRYCNAALECGIPTIATHSGTAGFLPASRGFGKEPRARLVDGFTFACIEAQQRGLTLSVECSPSDAVCGFDGFLEIRSDVEKNIGSGEMLKYTCIPVDDGKIPDPSIVGLCRIRDKKRDGRFYERFGDGDFDFSDTLDFARKNPSVPLILEYVNSESVSSVAAEISVLL